MYKENRNVNAGGPDKAFLLERPSGLYFNDNITAFNAQPSLHHDFELRFHVNDDM